MGFTSEGQFCSDVVTFNWILDHVRYLFVCVCIFSIVLNLSKHFPLKVFFFLRTYKKVYMSKEF